MCGIVRLQGSAISLEFKLAGTWFSWQTRGFLIGSRTEIRLPQVAHDWNLSEIGPDFYNTIVVKVYKGTRSPDSKFLFFTLGVLFKNLIYHWSGLHHSNKDSFQNRGSNCWPHLFYSATRIFFFLMSHGLWTNLMDKINAYFTPETLKCDEQYLNHCHINSWYRRT